MYITVPMRKQKNQKYEKKHQESIFKEIQYNTIFQKFNQEDQLKKSNGFVAFRQKVIKDDREIGSMRNSYSFIRHGSLSSEQWKKHRPSVSSIVSSKEKNHMFSRTVGEFFDRKKIQPQPDPIHQRPEERQSQQKHEQNTQPNNSILHIQPSSFQTIMQVQQLKPQKVQKTKKIQPTTLLDLKVQSIERLIRKSGKVHLPEDFIAFKQKDDKVVKKKGWQKFFDDMMRNTMSSDKSNHTSMKDKMQKLRRTATSHNLRKKEKEENAIQEIISVKKKRENSENLIQESLSAKNKQYPINKSFISRSQHPSPSQSPPKPNPIQQQNMRQFFSFVKGHHTQDQFSSKMSLNLYRKSKPKFYILQNSEQITKQSLQYKKITIESFKNYNPGSVLAFLYLQENHYKLRNRKDQKNDMMREVVP